MVDMRQSCHRHPKWRARRILTDPKHCTSPRRSRVNVLLIETSVYFLLPFVYMSLYASDKRFFIADAAAGLVS